MKKNLAKPPSLANLYEQDEVAWLEKSARLIREENFRELDYPNLAQYLKDIAERDRREVKSRLITLLLHLLKWQHQSALRSGSWKASILHQRAELEDLLASKTLKRHAQVVLPDAYVKAVEQAAAETGLAADAFPKECPYLLEYLLDDEFPGSEN